MYVIVNMVEHFGDAFFLPEFRRAKLLRVGQGSGLGLGLGFRGELGAY